MFNDNINKYIYICIFNIPNILYYNIHIFLVIHGHIKTNFNITSNNMKTFGKGSITDGIYKLEIRINDYDNNISFDKGQQVEIKGYIKIIS